METLQLKSVKLHVQMDSLKTQEFVLTAMLVVKNVLLLVKTIVHPVKLVIFCLVLNV